MTSMTAAATVRSAKNLMSFVFPHTYVAVLPKGDVSRTEFWVDAPGFVYQMTAQLGVGALAGAVMSADINVSVEGTEEVVFRSSRPAREDGEPLTNEAISGFLTEAQSLVSRL